MKKFTNYALLTLLAATVVTNVAAQAAEEVQQDQQQQEEAGDRCSCQNSSNKPSNRGCGCNKPK